MISKLKFFIKNLIKNKGPLTKLLFYFWSFISVPWKKFSEKFPVLSSILIIILISLGFAAIIFAVGLGLLTLGGVV